jgi:hypothetical protein
MFDLFDDEPKSEEELRESLRAAAKDIIQEDWIPLSAAAMQQRVPGSSYGMAEEVYQEFASDKVSEANPLSLERKESELSSSKEDSSPVKPSKGSSEDPKPKRTNKQGRAVAAAKVPTRKPKSQNEHATKIFHSKKLREQPTAHHVALALSVFMGLEHRASYGKPVEATARFLCEISGLKSENAARKAINHAVECGFYARLDSGNGGKHGRGRSTYVPTVPDF